MYLNAAAGAVKAAFPQNKSVLLPGRFSGRSGLPA